MPTSKSYREFINIVSSMSSEQAEALAELMASRDELEEAGNRSESTNKEIIESLQQAVYELKSISSFEIGDIVTWKPKLKNKRFPEYGQPAIVLEVLDEPCFSEEKITSPYYNEPLDVRLGFLDDEGDFISFLFDSHKFKKM